MHLISKIFLLAIWMLFQVQAWSTCTFSRRARRGVYNRDSSPTRRLVSLNSSQANEDDVEKSPKEAEKALTDWSSSISGPDRARPNPNTAYSVPDLEDLVDSNMKDETRKTPNLSVDYPGKVTDDNDAIDDNEDGPTTNGWFLEEDDYINSRSNLNPDGSLNLQAGRVDENYRKLTENLLQNQNPQVPSSFLSQNDEETLESLLSHRLHDPNTTSEALHRKVFEHEQGYLNQSKVFRQSLGGDAAAATKAAKLRHSADYRRRQDAAISKLNDEIDSFERDFLQKEPPKDRRCSKCGCALSVAEVQHSQGQQLLCSVCYADVLVAQSDRSFFREAPPPVRKYGAPQQRRQSIRKRGTPPPGRNTAFRRRQQPMRAPPRGGSSIPGRRAPRTEVPTSGDRRDKNEPRVLPSPEYTSRSSDGDRKTSSVSMGSDRQEKTAPSNVSQPSHSGNDKRRERNESREPSLPKNANRSDGSGDKSDNETTFVSNGGIWREKSGPGKSPPPVMASSGDGDEKDAIEKLKKEVEALHRELEHLKHDKEDDYRDDDNMEPWPMEETDGQWSQVIDPDTGEAFYWNEETEEMRWDDDMEPWPVETESNGAWSQVIDPDTGEVFYWNEDTEEMKWEQ